MNNKGNTLIATMSAALMALILIVSVCVSSGTQAGGRVVTRRVHSSIIPGAGKTSPSNDDKGSMPLDGSQQSESESEAPSAFGGAVEEEHAKVLPTAFLFDRHHHEDGAEEARVDHSYEAWFYFVTHPPLTPPPNFS